MSTPVPVTKKRRTVGASPTACTSNVNERLEFRKCLGELARCKQNFIDSVDKCQVWEDETLENLSLQLTEKKAELAELQTQFAVERKNAEIKLAQEIAEFRHKAALEILAARGETAIDEGDLEALKQKCSAATQLLETECKRARDEERQSCHAQQGAALKSKDLEHKAHIAELNATVEQQKHQIAASQAQIDHYIKEVDKQRELTKQVADSGRHGAIQQTIGKN